MTRQRILLIVLLAWALVMIVPDVLRVVQPLDSFGFYADNDGLIYDVTGPFDAESRRPPGQSRTPLDIAHLDSLQMATSVAT
jgi:hypothetical protein